jgi:type I restriction enzyme S subunit
VCVGRSGSAGKVTWVEGDYWPLNTVLWVTNFHGNAPEFVYHLLAYMDLEQYAAGVSVPTLNRNVIHTIEILLPPLPEQRAIAHILRAVQAAREARQREVSLERERKAALMAHVFTHGTRGEPTKQTPIGEMPVSWEIKTLENVILGSPQNGVFVKSPILGTGTRYINVYDTYQGAVVNVDAVERMELNPKDVGAFAVKSNDLLFVRSSLKREGVGQCCLVEELSEAAVFDCHLIRVSPATELVDPYYLTYYFLSERGRVSLISRSKTTTMTTINQRGLAETMLPIPGLTEQKTISSVLRTCDAKIAALERESALLDELFRALLEELMTGRVSVAGQTEDGQLLQM